MKKIITVFTICLVASVNAMKPENKQNIHHMTPVTQHNYVQPRQVNQFNQNYNLPCQTQQPKPHLNAPQENINMLRSMQNQEIYRRPQFAPVIPPNMLNNQTVTPQHQTINNKEDKTLKIQNQSTEKKPKKADAKDKKNAPKKLKKLTKYNLQDMQKLTRGQVNNRIREYIKDGKANMQNGTVSYLTPPIY